VGRGAGIGVREAAKVTRYEVYVDGAEETLEEGGYLAHVPALPGCVFRARERDDAVAGIRNAILARHSELRSHGLLAPADDDLELEVIDTTDQALPLDYAPLDERAERQVLELAEMSRQELLALLATMPAEALDWRPDEESWSPRNVLAHLAGADLWYASRLNGAGLPELTWRLAVTRELVLRRLVSTPPAQRGAVNVHMGEEWTPRKVARRMLEHEEEHLDQLRLLLRQYGERGERGS
jgi:predicted RNase H-like HicB family nuclease